jgi:hypothetical protein
LQVLVAVMGDMGAGMTLRSDADVHIHTSLNLAAGVAASCLLGSNISGETLQTVRHSTDQETAW